MHGKSLHVARIGGLDALHFDPASQSPGILRALWVILTGELYVGAMELYTGPTIGYM